MAKLPRTAKAASIKTGVQSYPRISDPNSKYFDCLDESALVPHTTKIPEEELRTLIEAAIRNANRKSRREIISIPPDATEKEADEVYSREGVKLFKYFKDYTNDPASTAHQIYKKNYRQVGAELFRTQTLQNQRMNSGWRYQFLSVDCARHSKRFKSVSGIGAAAADFNVEIEFQDKLRDALHIYVSVKNRGNTLGGQDWPKAIEALEAAAVGEQNRTGPYICVFGIAMQKGMRQQKRQKSSKIPYSVNTEVWLSDFFWPFFANYSYEEIIMLVLDVLVSSYEPPSLSSQVVVPDRLLDFFGVCCLEAQLIDGSGDFNDPYKLLRFFIQ